MSTFLKRWTYDDLLALPEDRLRHEIFDGEHVTTPTPYMTHQRVVGTIAFRLWDSLNHHPNGEALTYCDVIFAPDNVVVPDIFYVSDERSSILTERNIRGAPDFIAEVTSDVTRERDYGIKRMVYERFGVIEYWIADADAETAQIYRRSLESRANRGDVLTSPLFPNLTLDVATLFR